MKTILAIAAAFLLGALIFWIIFSPSSAVLDSKEPADPDRPWLAEKAPVPPAPEIGSDSPSTLDDRIVAKDLCAAGAYFAEGRRGSERAKFINRLWSHDPGYSRRFNRENLRILTALYAESPEEAISQLRKGAGWRERTVLALLLSGTLRLYNGSMHAPNSEDLDEALRYLDEAENDFPSNGLITMYWAMVRKKKGGTSPSGLGLVMQNALHVKSEMENPLDSSRLAFAALASQDPYLYAASLPLRDAFPYPPNYEAVNVHGSEGLSNKDLASVNLKLSAVWAVQKQRQLEENFPEEISNSRDYTLAIALAHASFGHLDPGSEIPERFQNEFAERLIRKNADANPSEMRSYKGYYQPGKGIVGKDCDAKWPEAVHNDMELMRDRMRKYFSRPTRAP